MAADDPTVRFKAAADRVIARFSGKSATPPICRRIELLLRNEIARDFAELASYVPTVMFRDGRPLVFLVAKPDNGNTNPRKP